MLISFINGFAFMFLEVTARRLFISHVGPEWLTWIQIIILALLASTLGYVAVLTKDGERFQKRFVQMVFLQAVFVGWPLVGTAFLGSQNSFAPGFVVLFVFYFPALFLSSVIGATLMNSCGGSSQEIKRAIIKIILASGIGGALGAGFLTATAFFFPAVQLSWLYLFCVILHLVLFVVLSVEQRKKRAVLFFIFALILFGASVDLDRLRNLRLDEELIAYREGVSSSFLVYDGKCKKNPDEKCRNLRSKPWGFRHSTFNLSQPRSVEFDYISQMMRAVSDQTALKQGLLIGVGAGMFPIFWNQRACDDCRLLAIDVEPILPSLTQKHFGVSFSELKTDFSVGSVWREIDSISQPIDFVLFDAFHEDQIPEELLQVEFFKKIQRHLHPERGLVLLNILIHKKAEAKVKLFLGSLLLSLQEGFEDREIGIWGNLTEHEEASSTGRHFVVAVLPRLSDLKKSVLSAAQAPDIKGKDWMPITLGKEDRALGPFTQQNLVSAHLKANLIY